MTWLSRRVVHSTLVQFSFRNLPLKRRQRHVRVESVPDARKHQPTDTLGKVTHAPQGPDPTRPRVDRITSLVRVPDGYRAMNDRKAITVMIER